jgi:hypothetical protein
VPSRMRLASAKIRNLLASPKKERTVPLRSGILFLKVSDALVSLSNRPHL